MNLKPLIAVSVAAAFAGPLAAQTSGGFGGGAPAAGTAQGGGVGTSATGADLFNLLDKDKDGAISHFEAKDSWLASRLKEFDQDRDGKLSREEFDALMAARKAASGASK